MTHELEDYRNALSGIGPLAYEWKDKPHRLVYDLISEINNLTNFYSTRISQLEGSLNLSAERKVCTELLEIMDTYHQQDEAGCVDTPGGLEHMGDVWRLFKKWENILKGTKQ